ncbi:hypothetical protein [Exiguobacterium sp. s22]|uniref:hypothetical protein n=1 Tax=Exiguobacterium sp. s22 TaxID=2751272 RepID=UPI001BE5D482|nr:hypothetical protein [Exiguobacterium sp. s22]
MAKFESRYRSLSFYVDGERYEFRDGFFETDDPKVSFALSQLIDVNRTKADDAPAEAPIHEKVEKAVEAEQELAPAPAKPKAPSRRKASTKE